MEQSSNLAAQADETRALRDNLEKVHHIIMVMSGFVCPHCGTMTPIFGKGGGKATAQRFDEKFLGELPLDPRIMQGGDADTGFIADDSGPAGKAMLAVVEQVVAAVEA